MPVPLSEFPLADADRCVKCGLCLPHCPTYAQTQHEGDSPRGRIALMQGFATGIIPLTERLEQHLDGCLGCRACEPVCPAKVPYGQLIDAGRQLLAMRKPSRTRAYRWLAPWLTQRRRRHLLGTLLWLYQRSGLQYLLRTTRALGHGPLARLESLLPRLSLPRALPTTAATAHAQLFTGCMGEWADRETLLGSARLAAALGVPLNIPKDQTCCGALHQHAGLHDDAAALAQQNLRAFGMADQPVLCSASGCTATLMEYAQLAGRAGSAFSMRVQDIHRYLLSHWRDDVSLRSLDATVLLHTPCTMRNIVKQADPVRALLHKIPGLQVIDLPSPHCCGAAGSHVLQQPERADALLEATLQEVTPTQAAMLITTNIGCAVHLAAGLRRKGLRMEVLHPTALLARQL